MTCDELEQILQPYLDGELDPHDECADVEAHLASCPACLRRVSAERHFKKTLKAAMAPLASMPAPEALRARIELGFRREARHGRTVAIVRYGAMAAAVTLVAGAGYKVVQHYSRQSALEDAAAHHAKHFPLEIRSADPRAIAEYFHGKVDYNVTVPQLPRAVPAGARLLNVKDKQAVYISYDATTPSGSAPGRVGLYVYEDGDAPSDVQRDVSKSGYNVVTWGDHNITYMLVSDTDDQDVMDMALPPPEAVRPVVKVQPASLEAPH